MSLTALRKYVAQNPTISRFNLAVQLQKVAQRVSEPAARAIAIVQTLNNYQEEKQIMPKSTPVPHHKETILPYVKPEPDDKHDDGWEKEWREESDLPFVKRKYKGKVQCAKAS